jgi:hypothetical protein
MWDIQELYSNIHAYLDFLQGLVNAEAPDSTKALIRLLEEPNANEFSILLKGSTLDTDLLQAALSSIGYGSEDFGRTFYDNNKDGINRLVSSVQDNCSVEIVRNLYVFLLIHLHTFSDAVISDEDITFIMRTLVTVEQKGEDPNKRKGARLMVKSGGSVLLLRTDGKLVEYDGQRFKPSSLCRDERLAGFALHSEGLIAFDTSGALLNCTPTIVRKNLPENRGVVIASAFDRSYALLLNNGSVVSNIPNLHWTGLSCVRVGLNSVVGILEKTGGVVHIGSDDKLLDYEDVASVSTRSKGRAKQFTLLKTDGKMITDRGIETASVSATCISKSGYTYSIFDMHQQTSRIYTLGFSDAAGAGSNRFTVSGKVIEIHESSPCIAVLASVYNDEEHLTVYGENDQKLLSTPLRC